MSGGHALRQHRDGVDAMLFAHRSMSLDADARVHQHTVQVEEDRAAAG